MSLASPLSQSQSPLSQSFGQHFSLGTAIKPPTKRKSVDAGGSSSKRSKSNSHSSNRVKRDHETNSQTTSLYTHNDSLFDNHFFFFFFFFKSCLMSIYNLSVMTDPPDSSLYTRCSPTATASITGCTLVLRPGLFPGFNAHYVSFSLCLAARALLLRIRPLSISTLLILDNHISSCPVISPAGRAIRDFRSTPELLEALRDAIRAHRSLYTKGKILQRDISENNIIITDLKEVDGFMGI